MRMDTLNSGQSGVGISKSNKGPERKDRVAGQTLANGGYKSSEARISAMMTFHFINRIPQGYCTSLSRPTAPCTTTARDPKTNRIGMA